MSLLNNNYLKNERGLTLLEVLLSITILGIVLMSFLSFFSQAYSYTKKNEDKTVGINVARNVLYYFEQQDFDRIDKAYFPEVEEFEIKCDDKLPGSEETVFEPSVCENFVSTKINNTEFTTTVKLKEHESLNEYLIPVKISVTWGQPEQTAFVEGVIKK